MGQFLTEFALTQRDAGLRAATVLFRVVQSQERWRRGAWTEANEIANQGLCDECAELSLAMGRANAAFLAACHGSEDLTRSLSTAAKATAERYGAASIIAWADAALGQFELGRGNALAALFHLEQVAKTALLVDLADPVQLFWQGDYIDALIATGRRDLALEAIRELVLETATKDLNTRTWATGIADRGAALLATSAAQSEELFLEAFKSFAQINMTFETARTYLARGKRNRTTTSNASFDLAEAGRLFRQLGATHWLGQVISELTSTPKDVPAAFEHAPTGNQMLPAGGESGRDVAARTILIRPLTPSEQRVANLISLGKTNREVATELFISAKTVDFHVQSMYRKFGVKNRAEFVACFLSYGDS